MPLSLSKDISASQEEEILTGKGWWAADRYQSRSGIISSRFLVRENVPVEFHVEVLDLGERNGEKYGAFSAELTGRDENGKTHYYTTNSSKVAWTYDGSVNINNISNNPYSVDPYDYDGRSDLQVGHTYRVTVLRTGNDYEVTYYDMTSGEAYCSQTLTGYAALESVKVCILAQEGSYRITCSGEKAVGAVPGENPGGNPGGDGSDASLPMPSYVYNFNSSIGDAVVVNRENENEEGETPTGEIPQPDPSVTAQYASGKNGMALKLDGTYGLRLPVSNLGKSYTISFWVKIEEEMANYTSILFAGRDYLGEDDLHWLSIAKAEWDAYGYSLGGSPVIWSKVETPNETGWPWFGGMPNRTHMITPEAGWKHITLTVDGNDTGEYIDYIGHRAYTYIDGELYEEGCIARNIYDGNVDTLVGINAWNKKFKGYIDDLTFYSGYITPQQARKLYQDALPENERPTSEPSPTPTALVPTPAPTASPIPVPTPAPTASPIPVPADSGTSNSTSTDTVTSDQDLDDLADDFEEDDFEEDEDEDVQSLIMKKGETCQITGGEEMALSDTIDMVIPGAKGPAKCNILALSSKWNMGKIDETCGGSYDYAMVKNKKFEGKTKA